MEVIAAVLREPKCSLSIERLNLGEPSPDEVLVRIVACGICHTDVACRDAHLPLPLPIVLGHEGAGVVERVGQSVADLVPGDHVLLSFGHCGRCSPCLEGNAPYCDHFSGLNFGGTRPDGSTALHDGAGPVHSHFFGQSAFSSHVLVHRLNAVRIPKDLSLETLAPLGCGIQTGAGAVLNCLKPDAGESIAVFGVGAVGLSAIMAAKIAGCQRIVAVDRLVERLHVAQALGATDCIVAGPARELPAAIRSLSGAVDYAVDTTGNRDVAAAAVQSVRRQGVCMMLGIYLPGDQLPIDMRFLVRNGITLRGSVEGDSDPRTFLPTLIKHFTDGRLPLQKLIKHYPLRDINEALSDAATCKVLKPVILL